MKKLLSMVLVISMLVMITIPISAADTKIKKDDTGGLTKREMKIGDLAWHKEGTQTENKLFIGLIKAYENEKVKVESLFDLNNEFKSDDIIYIDVKNAEFLNGEVTNYPEGYLISVYYDEIIQTTDGYEIIAKEVSAVEENGTVTICEVGDSDSGEVGIGDFEQKQFKNKKIDDKESNSNQGFLRKIMLFFKQLFFMF